MLRSLKIENFRCFSKFEIETLGHLNLLVGTNNSGKTSILEAIQLLASPSPLEPLRDVMLQRGEYIVSDEHSGKPELNIRHLFHGHSIEIGSAFSIAGDSDGSRVDFSATVMSTSQQNDLFEMDDFPNIILEINKFVQGEIPKERIGIPLSFGGSLPLAAIKSVRKDFKKPPVKVGFITSSSLSR